jgi:hypothetical protein
VSTISRITIRNPAYLVRFLRENGQTWNPPHSNLLVDFLNVWIERFDNIGHPKQRKLNVMALTAMVSTSQDPHVLSLLPKMVSVWTDMLTEVKDNSSGDALIYWDDGVYDDTSSSPDTVRTSHASLLV